MKLTKDILINMITEAIAAQPGKGNFLEMLKMNHPFKAVSAGFAQELVKQPGSPEEKLIGLFLQKNEDKTYHVDGSRISGGKPLYDLYVIFGGRAMVSSNETDLGVIKKAVAQLKSKEYTGNM